MFHDDGPLSARGEITRNFGGPARTVDALASIPNKNLRKIDAVHRTVRSVIDRDTATAVWTLIDVRLAPTSGAEADIS
jgi:hypothetical protein